VTQPAGPYGFNVLPTARALNQAPATGAQPAAGPASGAEWAARIQERAAAAEAPASPETEAAELRQAELESRHSIGQTTGDQFFRGVFDAILTPGALLGAGVETAGTALGSEYLRDLGRDIGKSASGAVAADLISELGGNARGSVQRDLQEQDEARPLLSTIARGSGMVAVGLGSGAATGGVRAAATLGAFEGAGAGAQTAYENDATLQDVLASAAIGTALGAALPAGVGAAQRGFRAVGRKAGDKGLGAAFKETMGEFTEESVIRALGGGSLKKLGKTSEQVERRARTMARDVMEGTLDDGTPVFQARQSQEVLAERVAQRADELTLKLDGMRAEADDFILKQAPELSPRPADLAARIETEVAADFRKSRLTEADAAQAGVVIDELRAMGSSVSLADLKAYHQRIKSVVYPKERAPGLAPPPPPGVEALRRTERVFEDYTEKIMDSVATRLGKSTEYSGVRSQLSSFINASKLSGKEALDEITRRQFSLTDSLAGAAALAGDLAGGGGALSALKGVAYAGIHKAFRERGSSILAVLSNRLARAPKPHFSVTKVGGREAQQALESLAQARNFMRETGEAVGDNPNVRRVAESEAKEAIRERFTREIEGFDPARWSARAPTPMQKVLHRQAILNTASQDMAATVERVAAMRPELPDALDVSRLGKVMKDADGPAAIGALQNKLTELAEAIPPTPGGADLGMILRRAADKLEMAEADEALQIGHAVRTEIARARQIDEAMGLRQPTDAAGFETATYDNAFTERAASQLRDVLASEPFGEAGRLYAAATNRTDAHARLADPSALREALRVADARGPLPGALHDANESILAAAEARALLTGEKVPAGLERELRKAEELFAAGEEAATLDGRSVSRIFEHLDEGQKGPDPKKAVWEAIAPEIDKLVPVIKAEAGQSMRGRYRPTLGKVGASEAAERQFQLPEEQRIEYDQRLDKVAEVLADPTHIEALGVDQSVAPVVGQKLSQLMDDMPKPKQDIRGKAFETMSSNDLRLAAAMYEATVKPLSVLSDFRAGIVDYDKVQYAWKQWPGLQVAIQAGILDVIQQDLDDDERAGMSDQMLTQLDLLAGFGGRLQSSLDPAFSSRIDALNVQPEQAKPPARGGALSSPKAEPTFTERVAGAQA
jgi:hypothetical protein